MKKLSYLVLGLSLSLLMGAVYNQFSPSGALSGTWNSQSVDLTATSFLNGPLPASKGGTGVVSLSSLTANPSATIGLSAINGSASTFMRSDAAPALSQNISPTWTGTHTFNQPLLMAGTTPLIRATSGDLSFASGASGKPTFCGFASCWQIGSVADSLIDQIGNPTFIVLMEDTAANFVNQVFEGNVDGAQTEISTTTLASTTCPGSGVWGTNFAPAVTTGPCNALQFFKGSVAYPAVIGLDATLAAIAWNDHNNVFMALGATTPVKYLQGTSTGTNQVSMTFGDTNASSTTNIVGGSAANTQANGSQIEVKLGGTTGSIGGGALLAGACTSGTVSVTGATTSMVAVANPNTYPGDGSEWEAYVSSSNTVTVKVCAIVALTPTASTYNVRVIQ